MGRWIRSRGASGKRQDPAPKDSGMIIVDSMRARVRPKARGGPSAARPDGIRERAVNTMIAVNAAGVIISTSKTVSGRRSEARAAAVLGKIIPSLRDESVDATPRVVVLTDGGFSGLARRLPGADWIRPYGMPLREDPGGGQRVKMERISRERTIAEHAIRRIKEWGIMKSPFEGTARQYNDNLNAVSGIVNLRVQFNKGRTGAKDAKDGTARRGKRRPGAGPVDEVAPSSSP